MPWIPDVNPNELIESSWGNDIRDRVVNTFTNSAERATAIPAPDAGMVTYLTASDSLEYWHGSAWVRVGPGQLFYKTSVSNQTGIQTTAGDVFGLLTGTFTVPAGRRLEIGASCTFYKASSDITADVALRITDGLNVIQLERVHTLLAPGQGSITVITRFDAPGGTLFYKAQALTAAGYVNITAGARLWVDDIGPASMPD